MNKSRPKAGETRGVIHIHLTMTGLLIFCGVAVAACGLLAYSVWSLRSTADTHASNSSLTQQTAKENKSAAIAPRELPPWGELIVYDIEVERPDEYISMDTSTNQMPKWDFGKLDRDKVHDLLLASGLTASQAEHAVSCDHCTTNNGTFVVWPDADFLLSIAQPARSKLYHELAQVGENHFMQFPFCFRGNTFDSWFETSGLESASVDLIKKLLYPRGNAVCFSDFEFVMRQLPSDEARLRLTKTLSRQATVLVKLRIRPDTDVERLLGYWGRGPHRKDIHPLLDSLTRLKDGSTLDIVHLLPGFARRRVYTYPMPPQTPNDPTMDCHWTSMNFFNETPDDRFGSPPYVLQHLKSDFYQVAKADHYGDVVFLLNSEGSAIHSAVYLADNIVFTKNGNTHMQPWTLMKLADMLATYPSDVPLKVAVYRNKLW
ncbi:MAG: hypothetical protein WCO56_25565 [Verrucomicrobiota bacterium]